MNTWMEHSLHIISYTNQKTCLLCLCDLRVHVESYLHNHKNLSTQVCFVMINGCSHAGQCFEEKKKLELNEK